MVGNIVQHGAFAEPNPVERMLALDLRWFCFENETVVVKQGALEPRQNLRLANVKHVFFQRVGRKGQDLNTGEFKFPVGRKNNLGIETGQAFCNQIQ